ncbi:puratrophin-1-like isoform X2 [Pecten maximus]|uniref:puratrophin-1-like isoform X2 n=1 Tax=Pecten maximus TaxID=6579 RepID=UPI0014588568|nr:puratrophin-1-like isoform X2 [Pecten maximus]
MTSPGKSGLLGGERTLRGLSLGFANMVLGYFRKKELAENGEYFIKETSLDDNEISECVETSSVYYDTLEPPGMSEAGDVLSDEDFMEESEDLTWTDCEDDVHPDTHVTLPGDEEVLLLQTKLSSLYTEGEGRLCAVRQARQTLQTQYHGDIQAFFSKYLNPTVSLLTRLADIHSVPEPCKSHSNWPLSYKGSVLIHLGDLDLQDLSTGEFYFYIGHTFSGQLHLILKYRSNVGIQEVVVLDDELQEMFTMDWLKFKVKSNEDLSQLLQQCLVGFEESLSRLVLKDVSPDMCYKCQQNRRDSPGGGASTPSWTNHYAKLKAQRHQSQGHQNQNHSSQTGGVPHAVPPGSGMRGGGTSDGTSDGTSSPRSPGFCQHRSLDIPQTILDVNYDLLKSGIAILPGSRDIDGSAIVFIFTRSSLWQLQKVSSVELARTLLYYRSVPREDVQKKGLKIVADIQGASSSTVNTLLETMYLLQGNCPGALSAVYMLANEISEPLVKKSPVYDPLATFRLEVLVSMKALHTYMLPDSIPVALDGHFTYSHDDWIRFQMKLDPFVSKLQAAAKYLVCIMQDLTDAGGVPRTTKQANELIEHHEQLIKSVFDDHRLMSVQTDGEGVINCLQREAVYLSHSQDYRDSMMSMNKLYDNLQTTIVRLVRLSDSRLCKLEQCLQLREFEEECTKVLSWVSGNGEEFFQRYVHLADNLKAIRAQQKEFEKFYYSAMTHIEKGNDLLDEASMLAQSGNFDEVTGYKELARTLKKHLQLFTGRLEETRERIESTASCYHLLDKTYEWALDAMKYVASMKMEHCSTVEGLDKLLRSLQVYLRDHPMMKEETFVSMMDLAKKLRNEKLMEQCRVARARCEETHNLLMARQTTLREAKDRMVLETKTSPSKTDQQQRGQFGVISSPELRHPSVNNDNAIWQPCSASTPSSGSDHTPSFCSSGTSPILPPANLTPQDMVFLGEGDSSFITEDMSDRVVASIPKILNNSTMRSSREDLTSPSETSSQGSTRSVPTPQHSQGGEQGPGSALTSHCRPLKKVLRRTSTAPPFTGGAIIEEEDTQTRPGRQDNGRTVSMITSSTDSLSSMPEEEEPENGGVSVSSSKSFTPVPVNSHLLSQNGSIPTGSLADLKLSGTEKIKRTLAHVMREMVQTERDYVCSLQFIIDQYVPELERDDVPQALRGKRNVIFGNLEKIYHFHRQMFLREVELCEKNPFQIAQYFLMHASQFYLYAIYNKNKPKSDSLMAEYGKYFFREKQLQLGDKMDLSSYLLKPVQRMGKYALLIKQIMKGCPHTDQEYQDLKAAEEMVKFQLRHGNDLLAMDSLRDCDVNLQEQGRLLRQEEFLVWQGRRKSMRHVFLFEDLILFSKTQRGRNGSPDTYHYKFSFKMADVGLTEAYEGSGYKFEIWFRRRSLGENYILQAPSSDVRHQWTKEISRVLWNQALKNRENHMTEMLSMGVGNKPCMDIKPSANNIQDRLLNYAVGNRGARTRNSVAVTSFEHLRQGNKRPHSIISVSSTSSSSSSHSGMFSILGPNFDMTDSPRSRQSIACMSNESGIGTDLSGSENDRQGSLDISRRGSNSRHYHPQSKLILSNANSNEPVSTDV